MIKIGYYFIFRWEGEQCDYFSVFEFPFRISDNRNCGGAHTSLLHEYFIQWASKKKTTRATFEINILGLKDSLFITMKVNWKVTHHTCWFCQFRCARKRLEEWAPFKTIIQLSLFNKRAIVLERPQWGQVVCVCLAKIDQASIDKREQTRDNYRGRIVLANRSKCGFRHQGVP